MTREIAKEICDMIETYGIEVIKAYGEGKVIQHMNLDGEWVDCDMPIAFVNNHSFRVKPCVDSDKYKKEKWDSREYTTTLQEHFNELLTTCKEKQNKIEELQKVCQDLSDKFDYQVKQVMKLEEENAELKAYNKKLLNCNIEKHNKIVELEKKISILLSCKNCPENKGGYICQKEYEDKCLSQKIQYIKELKEENTKLKEEIKKWKDEWQEQVQKENDESYTRTLQTIQLTKAKELIRQLCSMVRELNKPNVQLTNVDYSLSEAEQFLRESE